MKRRHYLRAAAGAAALSATVGPAAADHRDANPSDVSLTYDQSWLDTYRPLLRWTHLEEQPSLYGWKASSDSYDYDVGVYWCEYSHQDCGSTHTSHFGDHEPVYVYVSDDSVARVVYSAWHWHAARDSSPPIHDSTHPAFHIFACHHAYRIDPDKTGSLLTVNDLDSVFDDWLANGLEDDLHPGAATDPTIMLDRPHWWRGSRRFNLTARQTRVMLEINRLLNRQSADEVDL